MSEFGDPGRGEGESRHGLGEPGPPVGVIALVRFVSEMVLLVALGYLGWRLGGNIYTSMALSVVLPLAAIGVWGLWIAPRATRRLADPARLGLEVVLFGVTAVGLVLVSTWMAAVMLLLLYVVGARHERGNR